MITGTFNHVVDQRDAGSNWEYAAGALVGLTDHDFEVALTFDGNLRDSGAFILTVKLAGYDQYDFDAEVSRLRSFVYGISRDHGWEYLINFDWQEV